MKKFAEALILFSVATMLFVDVRHLVVAGNDGAAIEGIADHLCCHDLLP